MMRIEKLAARSDMAGRYKILLSDGSELRLYKQTIQDFCLYSGKELSDSEYECLLKSAAEMSAKMRAVRILSAGNVSKKELEHRLIQKGEDADCVRQAVEWMENMALVDDRKMAQQVVSRCISKGYGLARAKQVLYEKRIPKEFWDEALMDYPEQEDAIRAYIADHLPAQPDQKALRKVIDALLRKGHSYSTVRRILDCGELLED